MTITTPASPITARFDFREDEHRLALRESSPAWMRWAVVLAGVVVPVVVLWVGVGSHWSELTLGDAVMNGLPWVLLGAFFLSLGPLLRRSQARHAREDNPFLNGTQLRTVDDVGLRVEGAGFAPSLRWQDLQQVTETRNFFLFYEDKRVMHYIPKRALSDVERDSLRNLIQGRRQP